MSDADDVLAPIDTRSRRDQVGERIVALIRSRGLTADAELPTERELAQRFGVGRSTIREALRSLVALGYVTVRPGRGLYVGARPTRETSAVQLPDWPAPTQVSWQLVELRSVIELAAIRLSAKRRTMEDLERLQAALADLRTAFAAKDLEAVISADSAFHLAVARASQNDMLVQALCSIAPALAQQRRELYGDQIRLGAYTHTSVISTHEALLQSIAAGDAKVAEERMQEHLELSWEHVNVWPLDGDEA